MANLHYCPESVANMLEKLWYVSHCFTPKEYETYVTATHVYFTLKPGASLSHVDLYAFRHLALLVVKYKDDLKDLGMFPENYNKFYC